MKERKSVSITRDPRVDPQRGDEVRCGGLLRRVIRREGEMLWCRSGGCPIASDCRSGDDGAS
jgi:hypothetical protein